MTETRYSNKIKNKEQAISSMFNQESRSVDLNVDPKPMPWTAQEHLKFSDGVKSVVDVGSGSGRLLLEMLENGVNSVVGIDLAPDANELARKRMVKAKIDDNRYLFLDGSFLEMNKENFPEIQSQYDAISLHLVLCCHPDREGILHQSVQFKPKKIVLTVPRTWLALRALVAIWGIFSKLTGKFRPYIHSQKSIDKQLLSHGYELVERKKGRGIIVSKYELI